MKYAKSILPAVLAMLISVSALAADFQCSERSPLEGQWSYGGVVQVHVDEKNGFAKVLQTSVGSRASSVIETLKARKRNELRKRGDGDFETVQANDLTHFEGKGYVFDIQVQLFEEDVGVLVILSGEEPIQILDVSVCKKASESN